MAYNQSIFLFLHTYLLVIPMSFHSLNQQDDAAWDNLIRLKATQLALIMLIYPFQL